MTTVKNKYTSISYYFIHETIKIKPRPKVQRLMKN